MAKIENDMTPVIAPKADQLTADDLLAGPLTVKIRDVKIAAGTEQPVSVYYEGDNNKPWRPCKTVARLLVAAWGADAKKYVGRSAVLYRDEKVKWAGVETGGVRVSHLSHIESDLILALTVTRGKKTPTRVRPLKAEVAPLKVVETPMQAAETADYEAHIAATSSFNMDEFESIVNLAIVNMEDADTLTTWWNEQKPLRLQARDADKQRAGVIATRVADQIEKLKGDC